MRMAMVVLALVVAPLVAAEIVEGTVRFDGSPLPGCTVTLLSPLQTYTTYSNEQGFFRFEEVRAGRYEILYEMAGLKSVRQFVNAWRTTTVPAQELPPFRTECAMTVCSDDPPATIFDAPLCSDVELHSRLIESLKGGDRSALALIERRYELAVSYWERHRLAGVLLDHRPDADAIWDELAKQASLALRPPADDDGPERWLGLSALSTISGNPRARDLLHQALQSPESDVAVAAVCGFAFQHDGSALPAIAETLERLGDRAADVATCLTFFETKEADALAFKYITGNDRASYFDLRKSK